MSLAISAEISAVASATTCTDTVYGNYSGEGLISFSKSERMSVETVHGQEVFNEVQCMVV